MSTNDPRDPRQMLLQGLEPEPISTPEPLDRFPRRPDPNSEEARQARHHAFIESLWASRGRGLNLTPGGARRFPFKVRRATGG